MTSRAPVCMDPRSRAVLMTYRHNAALEIRPHPCWKPFTLTPQELAVLLPFRTVLVVGLLRLMAPCVGDTVMSSRGDSSAGGATRQRHYPASLRV